MRCRVEQADAVPVDLAMTTEPVEILHRFLDAHRVAHLATTGTSGPHGTPVFYARVASSADLVWLSTTRVLHSRHIEDNGQIAVSIAPSAPDLHHIEGVQLHGWATLDEERQAELHMTYLARYPAAAIGPVLRPSHRVYLFEPVSARFVRLFAGTSRTVEWHFGP